MTKPSELAVVDAGSDFLMTADHDEGIKVTFTLKGLPPFLMAAIMQKGTEMPEVLISAMLKSIGAVAITKKMGEVEQSITSKVLN
jgi:hypothetical protein